MRTKINLRNALTEMWNLGASYAEMVYVIGLPEEKIKAYLKSARKGYHTPAQEQDAVDAAAAAKLARASRTRAS